MISNCEDARGMIPWLLNGSLEEGERHQVLQHLAGCDVCRQDVEDTRLAAAIFDRHLPTATILALAWGETPSGIEPAVLQEHLAECPACAAELELVRMSRRLEEDEEERIVPLARRTPPAPIRSWHGWKAAALAAGLAGTVAFAGWFQTAGRVETLEERLAGGGEVVAPAPAPSVGGESENVTELAAEVEERGRTIEQMGAKLNEVEQQAAALSEQLDRLAQARPPAPAPQINAWIRDIQPSGDVVRGGGPAAAPEIPARTSAVLLLSASHPETHTGHAVEIVDATGKVTWSASGLVRDTQNSLYVLTLPPGALPAGPYTIRVFGLDGSRRDPLESYPIRVK